MAVDATLLEQVKSYCLIDTEDEDTLLTLLTESAVAYLTGAGIAASEDALYTLAVCAMVLHWHDHRGAVGDQTVELPLGVREIILQLRLSADGANL